MQWKNSFFFIALFLSAAHEFGVQAEQETSNENHKDTKTQLPTATFILDEPTKKVYIYAEADLKDPITIQHASIQNDLAQIWQIQKGLSQATTELSALVSLVQRENQENSAKLLLLSEQFPELVENLTSILKAEVVKTVNNALEPVTESSPTNSIEFDENLDFIGDDASFPNDCEEALKDSQAEGGVFVLKPYEIGLSPFGAFCQRYEGKGWTIIQRRQDGAVDFFRNWEAYKKGFGNLIGEYWLGLDRIHELSSKRKHELWIEMKTVKGTIYASRYAEFSVASEAEGYKLEIGEDSGNFGDYELQMSDGMKFSTFDKDSDLSPLKNCAALLESAWWYNECHYRDLNGKHLISGAWNSNGFLRYERFDFKDLEYVQMAIHAV